jgi:hypothetical protein
MVIRIIHTRTHNNGKKNYANIYSGLIIMAFKAGTTGLSEMGWNIRSGVICDVFQLPKVLLHAWSAFPLTYKCAGMYPAIKRRSAFAIGRNSFTILLAAAFLCAVCTSLHYGHELPFSRVQFPFAEAAMGAVGMYRREHFSRGRLFFVIQLRFCPSINLRYQGGNESHEV